MLPPFSRLCSYQWPSLPVSLSPLSNKKNKDLPECREDSPGISAGTCLCTGTNTDKVDTEWPSAHVYAVSHTPVPMEDAEVSEKRNQRLNHSWSQNSLIFTFLCIDVVTDSRILDTFQSANYIFFKLKRSRRAHSHLTHWLSSIDFLFYKPGSSLGKQFLHLPGT